MSGPSLRAARAIRHLGEVDPALAVLSLWCRHRDGEGATVTEGETITYGPGFERLGLPEQVGLVAHHVLHVALRHSARQAALAERLGDAFDPDLFGLAADGIVNQVLVLAGHALPRPAVLLPDLLAAAGLAAESPVSALQDWDADRLALALHRDEARKKKVKDWGRTRGFSADVRSGPPREGEKGQSAAEWRNHILRAMEAGRRAGAGIGRLGAVFADMETQSLPWEVELRGLLAQALVERPRPSWRRPAGRWVARMAEAERTGGPAPIFEPGRQRLDQRPRIVIGLDSSSSIPDLAFRLLATEAEAIARRTGAEVHLMVFDTEVSESLRLAPESWTQLRGRSVRRGGGTDFQDLFLRAARLAPSVLVVLTDLDAPLPPAPSFPVIWAVPVTATPPAYGRLLQIGETGPRARGSL